MASEPSPWRCSSWGPWSSPQSVEGLRASPLGYERRTPAPLEAQGIGQDQASVRAHLALGNQVLDAPVRNRDPVPLMRLHREVPPLARVHHIRGGAARPAAGGRAHLLHLRLGRGTWRDPLPRPREREPLNSASTRSMSHDRPRNTTPVAARCHGKVRCPIYIFWRYANPHHGGG